MKVLTVLGVAAAVWLGASSANAIIPISTITFNWTATGGDAGFGGSITFNAQSGDYSSGVTENILVGYDIVTPDAGEFTTSDSHGYVSSAVWTSAGISELDITLTMNAAVAAGIRRAITVEPSPAQVVLTATDMTSFPPGNPTDAHGTGTWNPLSVDTKSVPDSGSSLGLLAIAGAGLLALRRFQTRDAVVS